MYLTLLCTHSQATPWLFQISDSKGHIAWLYGSVHAANLGMYPLPTPVETAFRQSLSLAVEMRTDKPTMDISSIFEDKSKRLDGREVFLSPKAKAIWDSLSNANHTPAYEIARQRPWATGLLMSMWQLNEMDLKTSIGIDLHFLHLADSIKKPVLEIEDAERQIEALASLPDTLGWAWLEQELSEWKYDPNQMDELIQAWQSGDCQKLLNLDRELAKDDTSETSHALDAWYKENLLNKRNSVMADSIGNWIDLGKKTFVVIGAAHLCDTNGVPALLRKKGLTIKGL